MTNEEAAARLGVPTIEIASVDVLDAGVVIRTTDGCEYIDLVEPDADGKIGLMFLSAPSGMRDRETGEYTGVFPLYSPHVVAALVDGDPVDEAAAAVNPLDGLTRDELVAWAQQQTPSIDIGDATKKVDVRAAIDLELERRAS